MSSIRIGSTVAVALNDSLLIGTVGGLRLGGLYPSSIHAVEILSQLNVKAEVQVSGQWFELLDVVEGTQALEEMLTECQTNTECA